MLLSKEQVEKYNRNLIKWVKNHYWDSLEKDKDLILRHLRTFAGELNETDLELYAKLEKSKESATKLMNEVTVYRERLEKAERYADGLSLKIEKVEVDNRSLLERLEQAEAALRSGGKE